MLKYDNKVLVKFLVTFQLNLWLLFNSVTRLGDFWKFLETKLLTKVAQNVGNFLGYFENQNHVTTAASIFGQFLEKIGYFLLQHLVTLATKKLNWLINFTDNFWGRGSINILEKWMIYNHPHQPNFWQICM